MGRKVISVWLSMAMVLGLIVIIDVSIDFTSNVGGTTLYVNTTGTGGAYTSIQDAINDSKDGDTVFVYNGTYYENVLINKMINLTGISRDNTTIDGEGSGDAVRISSNWVNISGFTLIGSGFSGNDAGIHIETNNNTVSNNLILSNYYGILLSSSNNNIITENNATNNWYTLYLYSSNMNNIKNNNLSNNEGCVYLRDSIQNSIIENYISSNIGPGIYLDYSIDNNISSNVMLENGIGILLSDSNENNITNNNASLGNYGINLYYSDYNFIKNNTAISNRDYGIGISSSEGNNVIENNVSNHWAGILLTFSNRNHIKGNFASNNTTDIRLDVSIANNITKNIMIKGGISIDGNHLIHWNTHNIDTSNTVNGKPVYYWKNQTSGIIPMGAGQVILANCTNVTIMNQEVHDCCIGIRLWGSDKNSINNNTAINNNYYGIFIEYSDENIIMGNNASFSEYSGIIVYYSNYNEISSNCIYTNKGRGIDLYSTNFNKIISNNISKNLWCIYIQNSFENEIYHNNLINNNNQALDDSDKNRWDNGYPSGGNYWSNYNGIDLNRTPKQNIPPPDGLGDSPYVIDSDSKDNYPLMEPYPSRIFENYTILHQGWNLISIPLIQENRSLPKVLEMIEGYYDAVQWFNNSDSNDPWKHYKVGKPFGNDLFELNETVGFWIHITQPGDTIFLYNGTKPTVNQSIAIHDTNMEKARPIRLF
jgi:parallel beta-helix repeat protein